MLRFKKEKSNSGVKVTYPSSLKIHLPHEKTKDMDKIKVDKEDRMQTSKSFGYRKRRVCGEWQFSIANYPILLSIKNEETNS